MNARMTTIGITIVIGKAEAAGINVLVGEDVFVPVSSSKRFIGIVVVSEISASIVRRDRTEPATLSIPKEKTIRHRTVNGAIINSFVRREKALRAH